MEFIFLAIAILFTVSAIYLIGLSVFKTHEKLIKAYKTSEILCIMHLSIGIILIATIFITLCAANNTFWHLTYLTA